jgi:hypothetical protein
MELTRMLVEVPIKVQTPPNIEAKETGISNFEALMPVSRATPSKIGRNIAMTGVLLIKAERNPTKIITIIIAVKKFRRKIRLTKTPRKLTAPVLNNPALKINIAATVIVAVLLKPAKPSPAVITPLVISKAITISATKSTESFSVTNNATASSRTAKTRAISKVISFILLQIQRLKGNYFAVVVKFSNQRRRKINR